jgi:hypothetical protein
MTMSLDLGWAALALAVVGLLAVVFLALYLFTRRRDA